MGHSPSSTRTLAAAITAWGLCFPITAARAQDYGLDWVTVGDPGNPPYMGDSPYGPPYAYGRGEVDYEYRVGRTEVTTGQWMEFVNTFSTQSDDLADFASPRHWGATIDWSYDGPGRRYELRDDVESPGLLPVGGISWREAGMFCNWLHNGKSSDLTALSSGAYDTSTWGDDGQHFTDDPTHLPGAKFWIPTLDEALKAMNYDPDRYGAGQGGWWLYPNMSDDPPIPGLPGEGTTTAGLDPFKVAVWDVPLGAYADQVSPWGLLDTTGGAREWTEGIVPPGEQYNRAIVGAGAGDFNYIIDDHVSVVQGLDPGASTTDEGLRIASAVPTPGTTPLVFGVSIMFFRRRR
ncbi:MAG: SUMF1/EgtB/PvdO family nonheme iron enzyme [Phycisphaerales bacterium]|nr:SUMF1/EgtB/PvdO family nonheme iron enzyme [Phycisphaerales bacterium]